MSESQNVKTPGPGLFPEELAHLRGILQTVEEELQKAEANVLEKDKEYMDAKRYMVQYRGEIDPHEMFQNELALQQIDQSGMFAALNRETLKKLLDSPYFARIDFRPLGGETQACYIGRFSFSRDFDLLIYDWRAPLAGMFYDCEPGPAGFDAPIGHVEGALARKRQFRIQRGEMLYALESSTAIQDDVLQQELSLTSDEKMKSIISTIQKEQNRIIRNETADTLLIQGVAGSGKTSVALHRVAYLLYRRRGRLTAKHVAILSPNRVFSDYISGVLPELGEEPIFEVTLSDLAQIALENLISFTPENDASGDAAWLERAQYKASPAFLHELEQFLCDAVSGMFVPVDCDFDGYTATAQRLGQRYSAFQTLPVRQRLSTMAQELYEQWNADGRSHGEPPKLSEIRRRLGSMLRVKSSLALYRSFYQRKGRTRLFHMPQKNTLEWGDVFPFLLVHAAMEGLNESRMTRHLVIDEMQDYTPVQYAVLNRLFPCPKTILGDFGQAVQPYLTHTLSNLLCLYPGAEFQELTKSYRSTFEILTFANAVRPELRLEPMKRHGPPPAVRELKDPAEEENVLKAALHAFQEGKNASLGILVKSQAQARALSERLAGEFDHHLLDPDTTRFPSGILIASIPMSKGLEFDEVILPGVSREAYGTMYEQRLLYVACTRAMHRLTLLYTGEPSPYLPINKENGAAD